jgi:uncharacterized protein YegP (UPF0339 family)
MNDARFEAFKGKNGDWYVRLRARNGRILVVSEGYTGRKEAIRASATIRTTAIDAVILEVKK